MSICLSNRTADLILRQLRQKGTHLDVVSSAVVSDFTPDPETAYEIANELDIVTSEHVEVLVSSQNMRRSTGRLITHLCTEPPPEGSFYLLEEGIYLPTPCFCLLQQARELHLINLCQMLGYYLGTEQIKIATEVGPKKVTLPPLVQQEELYGYLKQAKGSRGVDALRHALKFTCPGAASPQETNLQLLLTLPASCYGFGLKHPLMNYEVPLSPKARLPYDHEVCRIDLYWNDDMGLEYQGEEHGSQLGQDYARFFALSMEKKNVLYLAKEQLASPDQMNYIAHRVASATGTVSDGPWWPTREHTQRLIDILVGGKEPQKGERRPLRQRRPKL